MKARLLLRPVAFFATLSWLLVSPCRAIVVTFDDLPETGTGSFLTAPYQGLVWSNVGVYNAILRPPHTGVTNGYYFGLVSLSNAAVNGAGRPAEIVSMDANFNFLSVYLTSTWNSNVNIQVQGFRGGTLLYDQTVIGSATTPTLFTFGYTNIDRLYFSNFGGQPAFGTPSSPQFAMDNFTFEFVPEPSALLLTTAAVAMLCAFHKRKRA